MKNIFVSLALIVLFASVSFAQTFKLSVHYSFKGIVEGYDHMCVTKIFVDDNLVAQSSEKLESESNTVFCNISKGKHRVRIVNYAFHEGIWEEHTIANTYSLDCVYEFKKKFKKDVVVTLIFDIDARKTFATVN